MQAHFIDIQSRRLFIEWLIEILSMIFPLEDDVARAALYNELTVLSDEDLVEKQKMIERYIEKIHDIEKHHIMKVNQVGFHLLEEEERDSVHLNLNI